MSELIDMLKSPAWWVTAVLVGVSMNLLAAYLKSPLDRALSSVSHRWHSRSERRAAQHRELVNALRSNTAKQIFYAAQATRLELAGLILFMSTAILATLWVPQPQDRVSSPPAAAQKSAMDTTANRILFSLCYIVSGAVIIRGMNMTQTLKEASEPQP